MISKTVDKKRELSINWKLLRQVILGLVIVAAILFFNARSPEKHPLC